MVDNLFSSAIVNALPDPIILVSSDEKILYINSAAEDFLAASATQVMLKPWKNLFPKDHILISLPQKVLIQQTTLVFRDIRLQHPRIGNHALDVTSCLLDPKTSSDIPNSVIVLLHPHRLSGKLDGALQQRGGLRQVSALTALLAHEVKNPLSGIRGAAQLLEQVLPEHERHWAKMILQESDRVTRLLDRLEGFGDTPHIERKHINIHEVINRVIQVASSGFAHDILIGRKFDPSLPPIFADFDQLVQVFLNLVKNAFEAVDPIKGEILITTSFISGVRLHLNDQKKSTSLPLMITVEDNGIGIDPTILQHLFEPFRSTKQDGRGIGLALSAKIIGDHGGIIEAETSEKGSLFKILLPLA